MKTKQDFDVYLQPLMDFCQKENYRFDMKFWYDGSWGK